jgi:chemotaxis methyl-accepting protein methylase
MKKEKRFVPVDRNLLIYFDKRQFRQVLIRLNFWLLTEGLLVRI